MGVHSVQVERKVIPKTRIRSEAISTANTPQQKLNAWWESLGDRVPKPEERERLLAKLGQAEQAIAEGWGPE